MVFEHRLPLPSMATEKIFSILFASVLTFFYVHGATGTQLLSAIIDTLLIDVLWIVTDINKAFV